MTDAEFRIRYLTDAIAASDDPDAIEKMRNRVTELSLVAGITCEHPHNQTVEHARTAEDVLATIRTGDFYNDFDQSSADISILRDLIAERDKLKAAKWDCWNNSKTLAAEHDDPSPDGAVINVAPTEADMCSQHTKRVPRALSSREVAAVTLLKRLMSNTNVVCWGEGGFDQAQQDLWKELT